MNKNIIFGKNKENELLDTEKAFGINEEAESKKSIIINIKIEYILKVMDNVSKAWLTHDYHLRKKALELLINSTSFNIETINKTLDYVGTICSFDSLKKQIVNQFGSLEALDISNKSNKQKYIPKGIILHYNGSNLFFEIIESLISGIITKNKNIVKVSTIYHSFVLLFLESIKEFDKEQLITPNQAIINWDEENKELEEQICNSVSAIIYNDCSDKIEYLQSILNYNIKLIDNSYKYSFAVLESKYLKANNFQNILINLASDICKWNQKSSNSPHVIYLIDKELKGAHLFIESLFDEMVEYCENISNERLTFNEKVAIRKFREIAKIKQVKGEGRLVCPEDFSFTLFLEYNSRFKISCLNRTVYIKRVSNIDNLIEELRPFHTKLQTAGVYASDEIKNELNEKLIQTGVTRITEIGNMCKNSLDLPRNGYYLLRELVKTIYIE